MMFVLIKRQTLCEYEQQQQQQQKALHNVVNHLKCNSKHYSACST